jgi:hypothetical protein
MGLIFTSSSSSSSFFFFFFFSCFTLLIDIFVFVKKLQYVKLVFQELYMIFLYYCVIYLLLNTHFYRHRIIMGS